MALGAGDMLNDNLELEQELGVGGMGSVWVAKNAALGNRVAVKILRRLQTAGIEEQRRRFEQEARGLAQLDHPHLVKIFDFGLTLDGDPFIVMELLKGEDLSRRLKREGPLPPPLVKTILSQTCRALAHAHGAGVVHRDIKPGNIFLLEADGEPFVKLVDFGVAKFASAELEMTKTGAVLGTPYYMSPEQFIAPRSIDGRTDLWSVAVVAYACLTGKLPFDGETLTAVGMAVANGHFAPLLSHRPALPPALEAWMKKALSVEMGDRFATAKELADAFAVALDPAVSERALAPTVRKERPARVDEAVVASTSSPSAAPSKGHGTTIALVAIALCAGGGGVWALTRTAPLGPAQASSQPGTATTPTTPATLPTASTPITAVEPAPSSTLAVAPSAPQTAVPIAPAPPKPPSPAPPASSAAASRRDKAGPAAVARSCWKNNEGEQAVASSSAQISVEVSASGSGNSIRVSPPGNAFRGFTGCCVTNLASYPYGPGPAETLTFTVSLPAAK